MPQQKTEIGFRAFQKEVLYFYQIQSHAIAVLDINAPAKYCQPYVVLTLSSRHWAGTAMFTRGKLVTLLQSSLKVDAQYVSPRDKPDYFKDGCIVCHRHIDLPLARE